MELNWGDLWIQWIGSLNRDTPYVQCLFVLFGSVRKQSISASVVLLLFTVVH